MVIELNDIRVVAADSVFIKNNHFIDIPIAGIDLLTVTKCARAFVSGRFFMNRYLRHGLKPQRTIIALDVVTR